MDSIIHSRESIAGQWCVYGLHLYSNHNMIRLRVVMNAILSDMTMVLMLVSNNKLNQCPLVQRRITRITSYMILLQLLFLLLPLPDQRDDGHDNLRWNEIMATEWPLHESAQCFTKSVPLNSNLWRLILRNHHCIRSILCRKRRNYAIGFLLLDPKRRINCIYVRFWYKIRKV